MQLADLVVRNGLVVTEAGITPGGVAATGGVISAIGGDNALPTGSEELDAGGAIIMPGGIDAHVHFHSRGREYRGDFGSNSIGALAGGTTTYIDFVSAYEGSLLKALQERRENAGNLSSADFALHAVVHTEAHLDELEEVARQGAVSFKHFMANPDGIRPISRGLQYASFCRLARVGAIATVHAENEEINAYLASCLAKEGKADVLAHAYSRPLVSEVEAIGSALTMARHAGVALHVFHISSREGGELVQEARRKGQPVTGETCPQYLLCGEEDFSRLGPYLQVNPPVRQRESGFGLWQLLAEGGIDMVVSDHYAPLKAEKERGHSNIWEVEGGVPGAETRLMIIFSEGVGSGRLTLERFVEVVSTAPARVFGLYPKKGVIRVGSDADIIILEPDRPFEIRASGLKGPSDWSPFDGLKGRGVVTLAILRGRIMARHGEVHPAPGFGKYVPRAGYVELKGGEPSRPSRDPYETHTGE